MSRIIRVESLLRDHISKIIQKDFRSNIGLVSIISVRVSKDLANATVIYSHFGSDAEKKKTLSKLSKSTAFIRKELGKTIRLKRIPSLSFQFNDALEKGSLVVDQLNQME
ncbi:MAG: 30S ribosome-binding factor RbfA [Candidatus Margulisbacteria bacterium]|jgi:ribosome-binding factor A|nr:30S ribosome-binding factor RbfA [Candidatus Margulisiibacteriota bacterium]|tara:strand:+ start:364 stop:693 length:330 start_codon:yes stop_codon:yes gene_type:complete